MASRPYQSRRRPGTIQACVLRSLRDHHGWSPGCGWIWDNYSGTVRVLDTLVNRGWATVVVHEPGPRQPHQSRQYRITDAGLAVLELPPSFMPLKTRM